MSTKKKALDIYLNEVFNQFVQLKDENLKRSQEVFKVVFDVVKQKMAEQCNYFKKYSSQVMYAGSVYDGLKVSKLDEFDMDIVIRLPISYEDGQNGIIIETDQAGYIKMKICNAFDNMDKQQDWEKCHKVTREWRDADKYFLQNKFRQWLHGIVQKALNELNGQVTVKDVIYLVTYKESGPAYTLNVRNNEGDETFILDVDLVPVIRFLYPRWPEGHRVIEGTQVKEWLAVPKPIKTLSNCSTKNRYWRLSFQEFEREMMKGCQTFKTTIRLMKKLRDALGLKAIASYYIKTLFLWKLDSSPKKYWQNRPSILFRDMLEDFYNAVKNKKISYFWHEENNLIENVKPTLLAHYADKLKSVLDSVINNEVEKVVKSLLTMDEWNQFQKSDFYQKQLSTTPLSGVNSQTSFESSNSMPEQVKILNDEIDSLRGNIDNEKLQELEYKVNELSDRIGMIEDRLTKLEMTKGNFNGACELGLLTEEEITLDGHKKQETVGAGIYNRGEPLKSTEAKKCVRKQTAHRRSEKSLTNSHYKNTLSLKNSKQSNVPAISSRDKDGILNNLAETDIDGSLANKSKLVCKRCGRVSRTEVGFTCHIQKCYKERRS